MCNQILSNQMSANPMGTSWFQWITTSPSTVQPGLESKKWENETNEAQTQGEHYIENTAIMVVPPHFNFFWVIGNQWWFKFDCFFFENGQHAGISSVCMGVVHVLKLWHDMAWLLCDLMVKGYQKIVQNLVLLSRLNQQS